MEPAQMVVDDLRQGPLADQVPSVGLEQALDRHCKNLVTPVSSRQASDKNGSIIHALVAKLLSSYEEDLIRILEENK